MLNKITRVLGWVVTMLAQVITAGVLVFLLSTVWYVEQVNTLGQFVLILSGIWLGFVIGVYAAGLAGLALRRVVDLRARARLISTAGFALAPILALFIIGVSVNPSNQTEFQKLVMDRWQPTLAQLSLLLAIVGFYVPGWLKR